MELHDSGKRTEFETGAVRDAQEGKGRMDLLPARALIALNDTSEGMYSARGTYLFKALQDIYVFMGRGQEDYCLESICLNLLGSLEFMLSSTPLDHGRILPYPSALIEVAKVFEAGAMKYEERNWEKGIVLSRYLDSGLRHLCKHLSGLKDESHLAQACWNFLCLLDTILRIQEGVLPMEINDLPFLLLEATTNE